MIKAFDIETIPNAALVDSLPEPEVALGNTKDPDKVREKMAEAKKKQVEKMGCNPLYGRICSFSFYGEDETARKFHTIKEACDADEIELIKLIFDELKIAEETPTVIITWNGFSFDFPFVFKRAALLRVEKPQYIPGLAYWNRKYKHDVHIDLMRELNNWEPMGMNLNEAGKCFLGRGKTDRDYSTYADLIKSGQGDLIGLDNLCDTELTFRIYKIVEPYLF